MNYLWLPWKFAMFVAQGKIVHSLALVKNSLNGENRRGTNPLASESLKIRVTRKKIKLIAVPSFNVYHYSSILHLQCSLLSLGKY